MRVRFNGKLNPGVFSKDMVMKLIAEIGIGGANGHIIEYVGDRIRHMSMDARMTICNMSIECGARAGLIAPDDTTFAYIKGRPYAPKGADWDKALAYWHTLLSDEDCHYDKEVVIDLDALQPMVTWGTNPAQAIMIDAQLPMLVDVPVHTQDAVKKALDYIGLNEGDPIMHTPIDWAFVGSCTNARIEDMRIVASILKDQKIDDGVTI